MSVGWGGMVIGHGWWTTGAATSGKSAVQLLQESKSRYVKSDRVLVSHQEPSRPDRFHISANPNIFLSAPSHTLHVSRPPIEAAVGIPPPVPPRTHVTPLTTVALALHGGGSQSCGVVPPPLPARSPRVIPRPRAKTQPVGDVLPRGGDLRRSLSHGPADRSNDVQMKLRRLLYTDSKESLMVEGTPEHCKGKRGSKGSSNILLQRDSGTFRAEVASVTIHKSLPDLYLEKALTGNGSQYENDTGYRRPSCPGAIRLNSPPTLPPRPPRRSKCSPPKVPARPPARPPPPKLISDSYLPTPALESIPNGCITSDSELSMPDESLELLGTEETRYRRPIFRSKSDVTHERPGAAGTLRWEEGSRRGSYCSAELEEFFDSMGLDGSTLRSIESPLKASSSPVYFEEVTSEESGPGLRRGSSDSDELKVPPMSASGCRLLAKRMGEPSIIEKNARVIKWLFNCQRARSVVVFPRSLSSGS